VQQRGRWRHPGTCRDGTLWDVLLGLEILQGCGGIKRAGSDSAIGLWQVRVQFDGACASVKVEDNGENRRIDCVALRFVILSCTAATLPCVETNCARCLGVGGCRARHVTRRFGARRVEAW
jgi:hypothetical protein